MSRTVKVLSFVALMALLCVGVFAADQAITGTVKDSSGGVIPGASITLTHVDTGTARQAVTDDTGSYSFMNIRVGRYEIKAELDGFQPARVTDIKVNVGDKLNFPVTLTVSTMTENLVVKAEVEQVQITTSQLDNVIDERRVTDLPLNGRNPLDLVFLTPGVSNGGAGTASANGSRARGNNYQLDGVDNNNTSTMGAVVQTNVDATSEFRVVTSNPSAEYGRAGGAIIDVITKSGTNQYAGNVFWFHRNACLDANEWDKNKGGLDRGQYRRNQLGASLGGPIVKEKLFFFANTEIMRYFKDASTFISSPTAAFRNTITNAAIKQIFEKYYPLPNGDSINSVAGQYNFSSPNENNTEQYTLKLDYAHSASHSFSARVFYDHGKNTGGYSFPGTTPINDMDYKGHDISAALDWTWIISPNLVNNAKVSQLRSNQLFDRMEQPIDLVWGGNDEPTTWFTQFGNAGYGDQIKHNGTFQAKDTLSWNIGKHAIKTGVDLRWIASNGATNFGLIPTGNFGVSQYDETPTLDAIRMGRVNTVQQQIYSNGKDFIPGFGDIRGWRQREYDFFVQDDWKVLNNLTINAGLRYEYKTAPSEVNGIYGNFDSTRMLDGYRLPYADNFFDPRNFTDGDWTSLYYYYATGGAAGANNGKWVGNGTDVKLGYMYDAPKKNFAPRFGFSWDVLGNGKLAVRGGYGISYDRLFDNLLSWTTSQMPFGTSGLFSADRGGLSAIYPNGVATYGHGMPAPTAITHPGSAAYMSFPTIFKNDWKNPYIQTWNFSVQKELWPGNILEVGYVGSAGVHLLGRNNPAQMPHPTAAFIQAFGEQVGGQSIPAVITYLASRNSQFDSINYIDTFAHSTYHSLQTSFSHRFQNGLQFQANYTYSKSWDNAAEMTSNLAVGTGFYASDYYNLGYDRGFSSFDVRHNFNANFIYELPFGPGKTFCGNAEGFLAQLIGGWQVNAIISANSGYPLDYKVPRDTLGIGLASGVNAYPRPYVLSRDYETKGNMVGPAKSNFGYGEDRINLLNPTGDYYRGSFRGAGFMNVDFSIMKDVKIPWFRAEGAKVQFRAEAFNLFNHTNYGLPNRNFNSNLFGQATLASANREIQFGLKLIF